ncbi:MAG TPA: ATPase domain-containing protein [Thermoplasmata archaeon]|nr:ATPase domain-containing protein [Thermoplasmata archaeon]
MRRIPTYVDGLDQLLQGGIPVGNSVLVTGAPGTMKTSIAYYVMYRNALHGEPGLYVSLKQRRESLLHHMQGLGLQCEKTAGYLSILDLPGLLAKFPVDRGRPCLSLFKLFALSIKRSFDYHLLVVDSLGALGTIAMFRDFRREVFNLLRWLRSLDCTLIMLSDLPSAGHTGSDGPTAFSEHGEEYLADGIIHLRTSEREDIGTQRQLRVVKMRGTRHDLGYHDLLFENGFRLIRNPTMARSFSARFSRLARSGESEEREVT